MDRLWKYLEARMPEKSSCKKTVNLKFSVNTAQMLIDRESKLCEKETRALADRIRAESEASNG